MSPCAGCKPETRPGAFLGYRFQPLGDGAGIAAFLRTHPHPLSGYTLAVLAAWDGVYEYQWAFPEEKTLFISFRPAGEANRQLLQPLGLFTPEAQERLVQAATGLPAPLCIVGAGHDFIQSHPALAARCRVEENRDYFNYIYRAADLASLAGKRYAKKRNLIAQAVRSYSWTEEPLTAATAGECNLVLEETRREMPGTLEENLEKDDQAVRAAIAQFEIRGQSGVLIRVEGRPVAFSLFEPQTPDTAVVHFERARRTFQGLHQVLNRAAARAIAASGFLYINREEDLGNPGLRQSKESYYPCTMAQAFILTLA
jgi:hypothetical protein